MVVTVSMSGTVPPMLALDRKGGDRLAMKRLGLFVDVGNLYYCVGRKYGDGAKLNYRSYLEEVRKLSPTVTRAIAYGAQVGTQANNFIVCLKKFGYDTKYKEPKETAEGEFKRVDWAMGIAMDVVRMIDKFDVVVLGSSNPALSSLVEWIKEKGVRVIVFACGIPRELKEKVDRYIEIPEKILEEHSLEGDAK